MTSPTFGWLVRKSTTFSALSQWRSIRSASVLSPRRVSHASNGPATAPIAFWWKVTFSARSRSLTTNAPPTTSECPPQYFVVECTTTSAPRDSGRHLLEVGHRRRAVVQAPDLLDLVEEPEGPAVRVVRDHDVVTGPAQRPHQGVLRGEAGGEREAALPLLQRCDVAL